LQRELAHSEEKLKQKNLEIEQVSKQNSNKDSDLKQILKANYRQKMQAF